jgi:3-phenylpropionate/trans-cinnamate dioxygenase ferredoxin reductase subunit
VQLADHEPITGEFVLVAAGVAPNGDFGPALGTVDGRIVVDAHLRTNRADVFAAGDMAAAHNVTAARQVVVEHWGDAEAMGEIAGANAAGQDREWDAVPGFWSEIGEHTLKYHAWGDGFDDVRFVAHEGGGFTSWYLKDGRIVGVLTSDADDDYDRGEKLVADAAPSSAIDTPSSDIAARDTANPA